MVESLTNMSEKKLKQGRCARALRRHASLGSSPPILRGRWFLFVGALAGALISGGCASQRPHPPTHHRPDKPVGYPCGPCAGYFPTCWRPWPDVCPSCPVFGIDEPTPTEPPMESVPLPPKAGDTVNPDGAPKMPEMEFSPSDAEPGAAERANPDEPPPAEEQSSAPVMRSGRPTSRRVVESNLPEWQMPPLPQSPQASSVQESFGADEEQRPVKTPRVFPASRRGEAIIKRANQ